MQDVNLLAMKTIHNELGIQVGYSDHTLGIEVPIAAVALGAVLIEKHFTLDRTMDGPDHLASLTPEELNQMVNSIRNIELAISGNGVKEASESEKKNINIARKSIHIKNDLTSGHIIKMEDLIMKRPADGISPMQLDQIVGKKTLADLKKDNKLTFKDISI
jgi:sialic acid synthase SpsE